ncbi:hypothetical protein EDD15DRAFT_2245889 [Pisolithus albus]|nr:hypothetical protein EDD15DRAFT_2245889 [Pisolithus albus]
MKAALHGAKLPKKPHQAIVVHAASHLWLQEPPAEGDGGGARMDEENRGSTKDREASAFPGVRDSMPARCRRGVDCFTLIR